MKSWRSLLVWLCVGAAICFVCLVIVVGLDVVGGIPLQYGVPLLGAGALACVAGMIAWHVLKRRNDREESEAAIPATENNQNDSVKLAAALRNAARPASASAPFRSMMILRRKTATPRRKVNQQEVIYDTLKVAA